MKRRLALAAGALVAALSFTSCSSVDGADTVAEVNGVSLSRDRLATIAGDSSNGGAVREALTTWIKVAAVSDDAASITNKDELLAEGNRLVEAVLAEVGEASRAEYEKGLDGRSFVCLGAITLGTEVKGDAVVAEIATGMTFAEAAAKYSTTATLAQSGGVVTDSNGASCLDPAAFDAAFPPLRAVLADAGAKVGTPVVVTDSSGDLLLLLRSFDDLSAGEQRVVAQAEIGAALNAQVESADITVSPRMGKWDAALGRVVAVGDG